MYVLGDLFLEIIEKNQLFQATFVDGEGNKFSSSYYMIFRFFMAKYYWLGALLILVTLLDILLVGFFSFHLYLVSKNQTFNESDKLDTLFKKAGETNPDDLTLEKIMESSRFYDRGLWNNIWELFE